jgi:PIN domain nuclease of toxin-antitoxin system
MNILLDTCAFLWIIKGDSAHLSKKSIDAILDPENSVFLSVISIWEILIKNSIGKLPLPTPIYPYLVHQREIHKISSLAVEEHDLEFLNKLGAFHRDPFDRILICQTLARQMKIATNDQSIMKYPVSILE